MSQEVEQNLQERLRLERVRQERLARVQAKREELGLPDTLRGRTEALERLNESKQLWLNLGTYVRGRITGLPKQMIGQLAVDLKVQNENANRDRIRK